MSNETQEKELYSVEFYEKTLKRLRLKLRDVQDAMDVYSFAIKSLEDGLAKAQELEEENADA